MIRGASLPRISECRDCHEPIRFVRMTATGRALPVNPRPETGLDAHGTVAARVVGPALLGYVTSHDHPADERHPYRFRPHFATCEKPRPKTTPTPAADAPLF